MGVRRTGRRRIARTVGPQALTGLLAALVSAGVGASAPVVTVEPAEVPVGSYLVIRVSGGGTGAAVARAFGRTIPLFPDGDGMRGIAPVPLGTSHTRHTIAVTRGKDRPLASGRVRVGRRPERRTSRKVGLAISTDASSRMADDRGEFLRALGAVTATAFWDGPLRRPVFGRISSPFGITRSYRGTAAWPHRGTDFAAPTGWPIVAAAPGVVVASRFLPTYGNLVIVDHGQTVHTSYLHMTDRVARTGDRVHAGQILGTIGMTGLATGPHLHFGTHVGVIAVDPEEMLRRGLP